MKQSPKCEHKLEGWVSRGSNRVYSNTCEKCGEYLPMFTEPKQSPTSECDHEIGRNAIGGFPGHEHIHPSGEQLCLKCGATLKDLLASRDKEWLDKVKSLKMEEKETIMPAPVLTQAYLAKSVEILKNVGFNSCVSEVNKRIDLILEEK